MTKTLTIGKLTSGGVITNYYCTSQCKHCLYGCSPRWEKRYIDKDTARSAFQKIRSLGCHSVHIGGGESVLRIESLQNVVKIANDEGVSIEYIETNSSWYKNQKEAVESLSGLKRVGVTTLLVSMSPFHNEYIPFSKVKGVIEACQAAGVSVFLWITDFYGDLDSFDDSKSHNLKEYCQRFGDDYIKDLPNRYWTVFGGRALQTYKCILPLQPIGEILDNAGRCVELADTSHFHFDLFGNYIPGLCSGLSIKADDLGKPLNIKKYPFLLTLYDKGIREIYTLAKEEYGFVPENSYLSKCHLCFDIRKYLAVEKKVDSVELQPEEFYHRI